MAESADAADLKSAAFKRGVGVRVPLSAPKLFMDSHNPTSAGRFGARWSSVLISDDPIYYWREKASNRDAGAPANLSQLFGCQFASACTIYYSHRHGLCSYHQISFILIVGAPNNTNNIGSQSCHNSFTARLR